MARKARAEVEGGLYHVIVRGNNRRRIFDSAGDYEKLLALLSIQKTKLTTILPLCVLSDDQPCTPLAREAKGQCGSDHASRADRRQSLLQSPVSASRSPVTGTPQKTKTGSGLQFCNSPPHAILIARVTNVCLIKSNRIHASVLR